MRWPSHAIETVRPSRFMPPFCPRPTCVAHRGPGRGFQRNGWYRKPSDPKKIPRFRCRDCKKSCSRQTFSTTYYLKRPALLVTVASGLAACSGHRQIARSSHCSKTSVTRMAERLGRHAILFHARCRRREPDLACRRTPQSDRGRWSQSPRGARLDSVHERGSRAGPGVRPSG